MWGYEDTPQWLNIASFNLWRMVHCEKYRIPIISRKKKRKKKEDHWSIKSVEEGVWGMVQNGRENSMCSMCKQGKAQAGWCAVRCCAVLCCAAHGAATCNAMTPICNFSCALWSIHSILSYTNWHTFLSPTYLNNHPVCLCSIFPIIPYSSSACNLFKTKTNIGCTHNLHYIRTILDQSPTFRRLHRFVAVLTTPTIITFNLENCIKIDHLKRRLSRFFLFVTIDSSY